MTDTASTLDLDAQTQVLSANQVIVADGGRTLLPATTLRLATSDLAVAVGEPGPAHTALALVLAGRLPYDSGLVSIGDVGEPEVLQRSVALVDVPGVSEPDGAVRLRSVVGEEMSMAGLKAGRSAVEKWLTGQGIEQWEDTRFDEIPGAIRTRVLAGLAACRDGVKYLVLVLPERHGGLPHEWLTTATVLAQLGFGVLVTASPTAAGHIDEALLEWIGGEVA